MLILAPPLPGKDQRREGNGEREKEGERERERRRKREKERERRRKKRKKDKREREREMREAIKREGKGKLSQVAGRMGEARVNSKEEG